MAIAFVQSKTFPGNASTPNSVGFTNNVATGNSIIVATRNSTGSPSVNVSDSLGNIYTEIGTTQTTPGGANLRLFYAKNIIGGKCTVTLSWAGGSSNRAQMAEYSGCDTTSPLDQTAKSSGTSTTPSSGNITTTVADELLFCAVATDGGNTFTAGTSFNLREVAGDVAVQIEDRIVSATGTYAGTMTLTGGSAGWAAIVASFKIQQARASVTGITTVTQ